MAAALGQPFRNVLVASMTEPLLALGDWALIGHVRLFAWVQRRQLTVVETESSSFKNLWRTVFVVGKLNWFCVYRGATNERKPIVVDESLSTTNVNLPMTVEGHLTQSNSCRVVSSKRWNAHPEFQLPLLVTFQCGEIRFLSVPLGNNEMLLKGCGFNSELQGKAIGLNVYF